MDCRASPMNQLQANLRKTLGGFTLEAEFTAPPGFTILFGASGAGKTTLLDCIAGLVTPDAGRIVCADRAFFDAEQKIAVRSSKRGVGYVFQDLALFPHLTARENVAYGIAHLVNPERDRRTTAAF